MIKSGTALSVEYHVVDADPLIERRKTSECRPAPLIPQGLFNLPVNDKGLSHIGKDSAPRVGHEPQFLESSHTLEIQFRPEAFTAPGREALHPHTADFPHRTVNPAEAESLLDGVEIVEDILPFRSSALYTEPAFAAFPAVDTQPLSPLGAVRTRRDADICLLRQGRR